MKYETNHIIAVAVDILTKMKIKMTKINIIKMMKMKIKKMTTTIKTTQMMMWRKKLSLMMRIITLQMKHTTKKMIKNTMKQ